MALDILIYYSDAFYSFPGWDGDGIILMQRLRLAMDELAEALTELNTEGWFQELDTNGDLVVTWEEMIPYINSLCNPGPDFSIASFEPLPESTTTEGVDLGVSVA